MKRRWGLAAIAWVVAAVLTTFVGVAAVESLGNGILGSPDKPLSRGDVESQLASSPGSTPPDTPSAAPSPTDSATPSAQPSLTPAPAASTRVLVSDGGTVLASCSGGLVTLLSWSPAQGYHVDRAERGPASSVRVRFEADNGHDNHRGRMTISCRNGRPEAAIGGDDDRTPEQEHR